MARLWGLQSWLDRFSIDNGLYKYKLKPNKTLVGFGIAGDSKPAQIRFGRRYGSCVRPKSHIWRVLMELTWPPIRCPVLPWGYIAVILVQPQTPADALVPTSVSGRKAGGPFNAESTRPSVRILIRNGPPFGIRFNPKIATQPSAARSAGCAGHLHRVGAAPAAYGRSSWTGACRNAFSIGTRALSPLAPGEPRLVELPPAMETETFTGSLRRPAPSSWPGSWRERRTRTKRSQPSFAPDSIHHEPRTLDGR